MSSAQGGQQRHKFQQKRNKSTAKAQESWKLSVPRPPLKRRHWLMATQTTQAHIRIITSQRQKQDKHTAGILRRTGSKLKSAEAVLASDQASAA